MLIKEIKGLLNLGLKEAKEMVEKAPIVIMKNIKKDKTEENMDTALITKLFLNNNINKHVNIGKKTIKEIISNK